MSFNRRTFIVGALTWAGVGLHAARGRVPARRGELRLASWNLRNFSGARTPTSAHAPGHDLERLAARFEQLDADILCLQEVTRPNALAVLLPGYQLAASTHGGRNSQHLVTAWRNGWGLVDEPHSDDRITHSGALRPILLTRLRRGSFSLTVLNVHLKAGARGLEIRRTQWAGLAGLLHEVARPRVLAGDFNTAAHAPEVSALRQALAPCGMSRVAPRRTCTAYWDGSRHDRFKEPSTLDHVFVEQAWLRASPPPQTRALAHCHANSCRPFVSTRSYPNLDFERLSDHCPLVLDADGAVLRQQNDAAMHP